MTHLSITVFQKQILRSSLRAFIAVFGIVLLAPVFADNMPELTEKSYAESSGTKGLVLVNVNWGRTWKCAGFENAQLQRLSFSRMPFNQESLEHPDLDIAIPNKLNADISYLPYALLIEPGEYAFIGFDVKVARSISEVGHFIPKPNDFVKEGKPIGGSFKVGKGEIVYIGHFGLDCMERPIPWRYYIDISDSDHGEFDKYISKFRVRFPFVKDAPSVYRLFETTLFAQPKIIEIKGTSIK